MDKDHLVKHVNELLTRIEPIGKIANIKVKHFKFYKTKLPDLNYCVDWLNHFIKKECHELNAIYKRHKPESWKLLYMLQDTTPLAEIIELERCVKALRTKWYQRPDTLK